MNVVIWVPKLTVRIRSINIVIMRVRPCACAHSAKADLSGLKYRVWRKANPPTTRMRRSVNIDDSGTPSIVGSTTFENPFSSISSAVKRMMKRPIHWMLGYLTRSPAIQLEATTMSMMDMTRPMMRFTIFPWLAPATASTLSSDMTTSAMTIILSASRKLFAFHPCSSWCSLARISR